MTLNFKFGESLAGLGTTRASNVENILMGRLSPFLALDSALGEVGHQQGQFFSLFSQLSTPGALQTCGFSLKTTIFGVRAGSFPSCLELHECIAKAD